MFARSNVSVTAYTERAFATQHRPAIPPTPQPREKERNTNGINRFASSGVTNVVWSRHTRHQESEHEAQKLHTQFINGGECAVHFLRRYFIPMHMPPCTRSVTVSHEPYAWMAAQCTTPQILRQIGYNHTQAPHVWNIASLVLLYNTLREYVFLFAASKPR